MKFDAFKCTKEEEQVRRREDQFNLALVEVVIEYLNEDNWIYRYRE